MVMELLTKSRNKDDHEVTISENEAHQKNCQIAQVKSDVFSANTSAHYQEKNNTGSIDETSVGPESVCRACCGDGPANVQLKKHSILDANRPIRSIRPLFLMCTESNAPIP
jgi:hypothetical protein